LMITFWNLFESDPSLSPNSHSQPISVARNGKFVWVKEPN
jgi:hypothetical protein